MWSPARFFFVPGEFLRVLTGGSFLSPQRLSSLCADNVFRFEREREIDDRNK